MPNAPSLFVAAYVLLFLWLSAKGEESVGIVKQPRDRESLRGSSRVEPRRLSTSPLVCRITVQHTQLYAKDGELPLDDMEIACIPVFEGKESDRLYRIKLPESFLAEHADAIESGTFYLSIDEAVLASNRLVWRKNATLAPITFPTFRDGQVVSKTMGTKTVAALRVSTLDAIPTFSNLELEDKLAGRNGLNMLTQYEICSFGKLQFTLAKDGVMDFQVNNTLSDFDGADALVEAVQQQFSATTNTSLSEIADVVLVCLPPGTLRSGKPWVASAPIGHWRAQFNDRFCLSLSTTMHEVGHLLGLTHSNKAGVEYNDTVGYMGFGVPSSTFPQKCFNAAKHAQLGWFADRTQRVDPINDGPVQVELAAFTDYDISPVNKPVLVNIVDRYFIQYNRAKKFNYQTGDRVNQTAIVEKQSSGSSSLAGLDVGQEYTISNFTGTGRSLVIAACGKEDGSTNTPDVMYISISLDTSVCAMEMGKENDPPSASPTTQPTKRPSKPPTPSLHPTDSTNVSPSTSPSAKPSKLPSSVPTTVASKPSAAPSRTSSSATTSQPTRVSTAPTFGASPNPSDAPAAQLNTNEPTHGIKSGGPTSRGGDSGAITTPPFGPGDKQVTAPSVAPAQITESPSTNGTDVTVTKPSQSNCDFNLIQNSDMEKPYDLYWTSKGDGRLSIDRGVNGTKGLRLVDRKKYSDSAVYRSSELMDYTCLAPGSVFEVNADFQLYDRDQGKFATCDSDTSCPQVRFTLRGAKRELVLKDKLRGYTTKWVANQFNHFRQILSLPSDWDGRITSFKIEIRGFNPEWDLIVDNFEIKRVKSSNVSISSN